MATQHLQHHRGGSSTAAGAGGSSIDDAIGTDLLHNIISRLPATSFSSAACVNRSWNSICSRILSYPKLSSAISLNPSLEVIYRENFQFCIYCYGLICSYLSWFKFCRRLWMRWWRKCCRCRFGRNLWLHQLALRLPCLVPTNSYVE